MDRQYKDQKKQYGERRHTYYLYWLYSFLEGVDLLSWVQCVVYREVSSTANVDTRTIFTDCTVFSTCVDVRRTGYLPINHTLYPRQKL
jgi:hypothetical protein